jgi:hypothetical protein
MPTVVANATPNRMVSKITSTRGIRLRRQTFSEFFPFVRDTVFVSGCALTPEQSKGRSGLEQRQSQPSGRWSRTLEDVTPKNDIIISS